MSHKTSPAETTLHQKGMKTTVPNAEDASTRCKGGSVNANATRKEPGVIQETIGPRSA